MKSGGVLAGVVVLIHTQAFVQTIQPSEVSGQPGRQSLH